MGPPHAKCSLLKSPVIFHNAEAGAAVRSGVRIRQRSVLGRVEFGERYTLVAYNVRWWPYCQIGTEIVTQ